MTYGTEKAYKCATRGCNTFVKPPFTKCGTCNGNSMESLGRIMDKFLERSGFGSALEKYNDNNNNGSDGGDANR